MKNSRRMKRMARTKRKAAGLNLVSLMDVFTILVFFLLVNSSSSEVLEQPREITLPDSVVETKPSETIVIFVSFDTILLQGKVVMLTQDALSEKSDVFADMKARLVAERENIIGPSTQAAVGSKEVTILADKKIPFRLLKKIMSTCTSAGYEKISLAVIQKASQN